MVELKDDIVRVLEIINFTIQKRGFSGIDEPLISIYENDLLLGDSGIDLLRFASGLQYLHDHNEIMIVGNDSFPTGQSSYYEDHFFIDKERDSDVDFVMNGHRLFDIFVSSSVTPLLAKYKSASLILSADSTPEKKFYFNPDTGQFQYFDAKGILQPKSNEFKVLKALHQSPNKQCSYETIIQSYMGEIEVSKSHKDDLSQILKSLKRKLGILPKSKKNNPDIFQSISKWGYKLDISQP